MPARCEVIPGSRFQRARNDRVRLAMVGFAALYPPCGSSLLPLLVFIRELAQAGRAQAAGALLRHRQPHRLLRTPARAFWIAAERGSASWTVNLTRGEDFFPICHAKSQTSAAVLMWGSSRTALPWSVTTIAARCP